MKRERYACAAFGVIACAAIAVMGCQSTETTPIASPTMASDSLVGRWGLAAYHNEADKARTEAAAHAQCNNPYVITKGTSGGVMMHLADEPQPQELVLKSAAGGKTYLGPPGAAGGPRDREVVSLDSDVFITRWVDPDAASRYGTMIYVRCKPKTS